MQLKQSFAKGYTDIRSAVSVNKLGDVNRVSAESGQKESGKKEAGNK
jgi:hypothetical protein